MVWSSEVMWCFLFLEFKKFLTNEHKKSGFLGLGLLAFAKNSLPEMGKKYSYPMSLILAL